MLKVFVEEAAALASLTLFIGMVAIGRNSLASFENQAARGFVFARVWVFSRLGKSRTRARKFGFRVDSSGRRLHHRGSEFGRGGCSEKSQVASHPSKQSLNARHVQRAGFVHLHVHSALFAAEGLDQDRYQARRACLRPTASRRSL